MTPEERAAQIEWPEDTISMSKEEADALVAASIRAAENDTLERTAIKAIEMFPNLGIGATLAGFIRLQKNPPDKLNGLLTVVQLNAVGSSPDSVRDAE